MCHWHSAPSVLPADKTKLLPLSLRHVFRSACFSKILRIGFCENKKADAISSFTKIQNTSAQSFDLIGHYSFLLTDSYRPFLIMSKTKGTNFLRLMPFGLIIIEINFFSQFHLQHLSKVVSSNFLIYPLHTLCPSYILQ